MYVIRYQNDIFGNLVFSLQEELMRGSKHFCAEN